jgi:hypothetical protein
VRGLDLNQRPSGYEPDGTPRKRLRDHLHFFDKLIENKHMSETTNDTNMTGNADNGRELRTNCGQGINQDVLPTQKGWHWCRGTNGVWVVVDVDQMPWHDKLMALIPNGGLSEMDWWRPLDEVRGTWGARIPTPDEAPSDAVDQEAIDERIYALDQYELACRLERELAEAREQRDTLAEALEKHLIYIGVSPKDWSRPHIYPSPLAQLGLKALAAVKGGGDALKGLNIQVTDAVPPNQIVKFYPPKHPGQTCHLCGAEHYACQHVPGVNF